MLRALEEILGRSGLSVLPVKAITAKDSRDFGNLQRESVSSMGRRMGACRNTKKYLGFCRKNNNRKQ